MIGFCFLLFGDVVVVGSLIVNYLIMFSVVFNIDVGKILWIVESIFVWDVM